MSKRLWKRLWGNRAGQGLTEYALLLMLVSLGLILLLGRFRNAVGNSYKNSTTCLNGTVPIFQANVGGTSTPCVNGGNGNQSNQSNSNGGNSNGGNSNGGNSNGGNSNGGNGSNNSDD